MLHEAYELKIVTISIKAWTGWWVHWGTCLGITTLRKTGGDLEGINKLEEQGFPGVSSWTICRDCEADKLNLWNSKKHTLYLSVEK